MDRLKKKHAAAAKFIPEPEIIQREAAKFGVITMGGCHPACLEALDLLDHQGTPADYMRLKGFPFSDVVERFLAEHEFCFVVEQSRDAQLKSLLTLETAVPKEKLKSVLSYSGFPLSAQHVVKGILECLR
jgi:2-oxoglutarate ferredoxin oxidoreductase subunit alpha